MDDGHSKCTKIRHSWPKSRQRKFRGLQRALICARREIRNAFVNWRIAPLPRNPRTPPQCRGAERSRLTTAAPCPVDSGGARGFRPTKSHACRFFVHFLCHSSISEAGSAARFFFRKNQKRVFEDPLHLLGPWRFGKCALRERCHLLPNMAGPPFHLAISKVD
jgi:hypothetical protein